jgi:ABC-type dipeptide/oligopeptide/nickel transport system permease component
MAEVGTARLAGAALRRLARRAAALLAVLLLVSIATFGLLNLLPGDPAVAILGTNATQENLAVSRWRSRCASASR